MSQLSNAVIAVILALNLYFKDNSSNPVLDALKHHNCPVLSAQLVLLLNWHKVW